MFRVVTEFPRVKRSRGGGGKYFIESSPVCMVPLSQSCSSQMCDINRYMFLDVNQLCFAKVVLYILLQERTITFVNFGGAEMSERLYPSFRYVLLL